MNVKLCVGGEWEWEVFFSENGNVAYVLKEGGNIVTLSLSPSGWRASLSNEKIGIESMRGFRDISSAYAWILEHPYAW